MSLPQVTGVRALITDDLVKGLLTSHHPDLADLEIGRHYTRQEHVTVRVGDDWGVRLPLRVELDPYYARVLGIIRQFRHTWDFPFSGPIRVGLPCEAFPYHWEVTNWITASNASLVPLLDRAGTDLGGALRQIHSPALKNAPANPRTMPPLANLSNAFARLLARVQGNRPAGVHIKRSVLVKVWNAGLEADRDMADTWTHGRLEPRAVLSDQGKMAGLLMWEFLGAGDPAADLGRASTLFRPEAQEQMFAAYGSLSSHSRSRLAAHQAIGLLLFVSLEDHALVRAASNRLVDYGFAQRQ